MFIALMALAIAQVEPVSVNEPCPHDRAALLALSPADFDQDLEGGWRPLGEKPECAAIAADLLAAYRKARWADLTQSELHTNYWHEGQLRAGLGQTQAATRLMMAGVNPEMSRSGFSDYALGTIAFLHQDRPGLIAARERLAALPKPADFDQAAQRFKAAYGFDLEWPANLKVLDGFIACFDRPYNEAYGSCAAAAEKAAAGRH
ncbi:hypothetical protein [Brevundimonas pondensis]|uniref:DUF4375 domain-containing protein n=1 Tax=Brevundimonas pondensis TaxID=2774189 RepID=A0ABX7SKT1_9CAUL|nr:hypothetical protein [Brevundimonas pondensis]QTC86940.1 hypothetical protein IFE19_12470 [Brevundimonas pondensis]